MPNDQDTPGDELQLETEDTQGGESVEDTQNTDDPKGEGESDTELDLDDKGESEVEQKLSPGEEQAKAQEETWLLNITSEKKSIEDAPKWLQPKLKQRLEATQNPDKTEDAVKKVLAEREEEAEFQALKGTLPTLTKAQADELKQKYASLRPAGKAVALRTAMEAMGLTPDSKEALKQAEQRGIAKGKLTFPKSGQPSVSTKDEEVGGIPKKVVQSDKEWNELVMSQQLD